MILVHWGTIAIGSFKKGHYLWSKYRFKLSPPNEDGAELFSMIVHEYLIKQKNNKMKYQIEDAYTPLWHPITHFPKASHFNVKDRPANKKLPNRAARHPSQPSNRHAHNIPTRKKGSPIQISTSKMRRAKLQRKKEVGVRILPVEKLGFLV